MKFTNKRNVPLLKAGYVLLLTSMLAFFTYHFFVVNTTALSNYQLTILLICYLVFFVYWYINAKYIEYDSKGLGVVFVTKGIVLNDISNYREQRIEIPKNKLANYKLVNRVLYKKIYLYIKGSNGIKKVGINISFLKTNKIKALIASLDKIVRENSSK